MTDWNEEIPKALDEIEYKVVAVVRKVGTQYCIFSKTGKNLGCYPTKKKAQDRLSEIEMFKHMKDKK